MPKLMRKRKRLMQKPMPRESERDPEDYEGVMQEARSSEYSQQARHARAF
jgi:hypothetical protein